MPTGRRIFTKSSSAFVPASGTGTRPRRSSRNSTRNPAPSLATNLRWSISCVTTQARPVSCAASSGPRYFLLRCLVFSCQSDPSDIVDPCRRVSIPGASHLQSLAVVHRSKDGVEILRLPRQRVILQLPRLLICVAHSAQPEVKEHRFHQTSSSRCA